MKKLIALAALLPFLGSCQSYTLGPDSQRQQGVPKGVVTQYPFPHSKVFPGTARSYWVYVPAQYKPEKPLPFMVFFDGGGYVNETGQARAPIVLDNLIAKGDLPVMAAIFVDPGVMPALNSETQQSRYNRSYEYDGLGDRNARFLIEELIPEVAARLNLSKNPDDHAVGGGSSGGIAAFTAAWERPDYFHRVMSFIGSYTDLKGGDVYPGLIRKMEPKPLRIFLQDGEKDQDIYSGNWWIMNQHMAASLKFAGYDYKFVTGTQGHSGQHGGAILPDVLRWLWRDYGTTVRAKMPPPDDKKPSLQSFVTVEEPWEVVASGHQFTDGPAVDKDGNVYFVDTKEKKIYKSDFATKRVTVFKEDSGGIYGLMFGADGRLYATQIGRKRIVSFGMDGSEKVLAEGVESNDLCVSARGDVYWTDPAGHRIWYVNKAGQKRVVFEDQAIVSPNGIRFSPDQSLLIVADSKTKFVWSFQVQPDGSLANGQPFYRMETYDDTDAILSDGMTLDTEGFLYVATKMGIQVCDQPGRVNAIISNPAPGRASNIVFGGPNLDWLYATQGDKVYRRHTRRKGVNAWTVVKPPKPGL